ncbi:MAG: hypothetical protein AAGG00_01375 [Cyanobacteria bacterium P01_H01_bin.150]
MTKKKMLGKLSSFSGIKNQPEAEQQPETTQETKAPSSTRRQQKPATPSKTTKKSSPTSTTVEHSSSTNSTNTLTTKQQPAPVKEKPVTVNIKISRTQHEWLTDTARTVRDNNTEPVPPGDRVYPQHLIGVAIELLQAGDIDWSEVKNVEDLKRFLDI